MFASILKDEEKFLINLLFDRKYKNLDFLKNINFSKLIVLLSEHLLIPLFYYKSLKNGYISEYPKDFSKYIEAIYKINRDRNQILISEMRWINNKFREHEIHPIFIKGSSFIISNLYDDIGVRMVGDIDVLVLNSKYNKAYDILKKKGYTTNLKFNFNENYRHLPRLYKEGKYFPVEIHSRFVEKYNSDILELKNVTKSLIKVNGFKIMRNNINLLHNIYNQQINDLGYYKSSFNYRNLYDTFLLSKKQNLKIKIDDDILAKYILIIRELRLPIFENIKVKKSKIFSFIFRMKRKFTLYRKLSNFFVKELININYRKKQLIYFFRSRDYRVYLLKKLIN